MFFGIETPVMDAKKALKLVGRILVELRQLLVVLNAGNPQILWEPHWIVALMASASAYYLRGVGMQPITRNVATAVEKKVLTKSIGAHQRFQHLKAGRSFKTVAAELGTSKRRARKQSI